MLKRIVTGAMLLLSGLSWAQAPLLLGYQGRLLKMDGTPETGNVQMRFGFFAGDTGGTSLWEETQAVALTQGFYSTYLGRAMAFPATVFDASTVWLEVAVQAAGDTQFRTMTPRQRVGSVAYAISARNVKGGAVDATSVSVNGTPVFDSNGKLTSAAGYTAGPGISIDGTTRALSVNSSGCSTGQVLQWNGSNWQCATMSGGSGGISGVTGSGAIVVTNGTTAPVVSVTFGSTANTVAQGNDSRFGNATSIQGAPVAAGAVNGQVLGFSGTGWAPVTPTGVASVTAGTGLTGGTISTSGTIGIANGGVGAAQLATGAVGADKLAVAAVTSDKLAAEAVTTDKLAAGAVTFEKLAISGCTNGQVLRFNAGTWQCASGGITGVTGTGPVVVASGTTAPVISLAVGVDAGTVAAGNDSRFGNATSIQGAPVGAASPGNGQVLGFDGTNWVGVNPSGSVSSISTGAGLTGGPISTTGTISIADGGVDTRQLANGAVTFAKMNSNGCAAGQLAKWNGTAWSCGDDATGAGGSQIKQYTVAFMMRNATSCPTGFNQEPLANLQGGDGNVRLVINDGSLFIGASGGAPGYGGNYVYVNVTTTELGPTGVLCWQTYSTLGNPTTHFIGATGTSATCPSGYFRIPVNDVRGNNTYAYLDSNQGGFFFGFVSAWDRGSQPHAGGWTYRYWANTLAGNIDVACLKVMGVEADPATRNGVYPVVLGVKGPAICPTGYTYRSTPETMGSNNLTYMTITDSAVVMGGLYDWNYGGASYQQTNWTSTSNSNYCWKFYPRTGKVAANVRALNGFNCPSDHVSLNVSDVNGNNANVYIQRTTGGLFVGGLGNWARSDTLDGFLTSNITTQANRICYKLENVSSWP